MHNPIPFARLAQCAAESRTLHGIQDRRTVRSIGRDPFAITQEKCPACNAAILHGMKSFYAEIDRRLEIANRELLGQGCRVRRNAERRSA